MVYSEHALYTTTIWDVDHLVWARSGATAPSSLERAEPPRVTLALAIQPRPRIHGLGVHVLDAGFPGQAGDPIRQHLTGLPSPPPFSPLFRGIVERLELVPALDEPPPARDCGDLGATCGESGGQAEQTDAAPDIIGIVRHAGTIGPPSVDEIGP